MSDSYEVVAASLTAHAGQLVGLSDELRTTTDLAGNMTSDAYGQTCQRFASMLDSLAQAGKETLQAAVEALDTEASKVRAAADAYERQETSGVDTFGGIR